MTYAFCLLALLLSFSKNAISQTSKGTEFWICFPANAYDQSTQLYITSEQNSTVVVDIPGLGFNQVINVSAGILQTVNLPYNVHVRSQYVPENKGIHITATTDITVYGMNAQSYTTDAFLAYPINALGTEYYVLGYTKDFSYTEPTQATFVATQNNTTLTITFVPVKSALAAMDLNW